MKKIELLELDMNVELLSKKGAEAQKQLEYLKNEAKFFQNSIKEGDGILEKYTDKLAEMERQGKKNTKEYNNLKNNIGAFNKKQDETRQKLEVVNSSLRKQKKSYSDNKRQIDVYNKTAESSLGIITKTDGSINELNQAVANNRKIYRSLTKEQRENEAVGGRLLKTINKQDKEYKKLQVSIGTTQVQVGNYKEQIKEALAESSGFSRQMDSQISQIPIVGSSLSAVTVALRGYAKGQLAAASATSGTTKGLKFFKLALIGTGIGAILVALGSLVAYFSSTQSGIDKVNKLLIPLKVVFQSLIGVFQRSGEAMANAFSNPKEAIVKLWELIKTNLVNRVTALGGIFKSLGKIISSGFTDGYKDFANSTLQLTTGVEDVIGKVQDASKNTSKFFDEAFTRGQKIAQLNIDIEESENKLVLSKAELLNKIKEQELISKKTTLSDAVRLKSVEEAKRLTQQLADEERSLLLLKIQKLELDQQSNDTTREEYKELAQLKADLITKDTEARAIDLKFLGVSNSIKKKSAQDAINFAKKQTDIALKESKIQLNIFIASQGTKAKTLKQELKLAEDISKKKIDILKEELDAKKITQSEYDLAILEIDNDLIQKRAELAVDNAQRELEIFKETHQAKLDANTFFTEELLNQEIIRLDAIAEKEQEYHLKRLEQGIINQQEYNEAINLVDEENRIAKEEAQAERDEAIKEEEVLNFELQQLEDEERFTNRFDLEFARLEAEKKRDVKAAKGNAKAIEIIEKKSAVAKQKIQEALDQSKLASLGATLGIVSDILGKESKLGKAAALAQALINTYQGISAGVALGYPAAIPAVLAASVAGFGAVKKIVSTKPPRAEKGMSLNIGGKRHSAGGTQFYGEDGTHFEAEAGEQMFILNRDASAALGPLLSDINQQYGGVSLSHASNYLESGGQVIREVNKVSKGSGVDYDLQAQKIGMAVGEANKLLPNPVTDVGDIITAVENHNEVVSGASR